MTVFALSSKLDFDIREAKPDDAEAISILLLAASESFFSCVDRPDPAAVIAEAMRPAAIRNHLQGSDIRFHVAACDDTVAGVIGVRDRSHLHHLIVAEAFHGRGLGTRLWNVAKATALKSGSPGSFSVYASDRAVAFFQCLGFQRGSGDGGERLPYIPMRLKSAQSAL